MNQKSSLREDLKFVSWMLTGNSLDNLTPADVYFGRAETILAERQRIKRETLKTRRLQHQLQAA